MERDREDLAAFILRMRSRESLPVRLFEAIEQVPRRLFVPKGIANVYADQSFPLPCGETMPSAARVVSAVAALKVQPDSRILEIGTGSGYATALLGRLGARVVSLDRYRTLVDEARERLSSLGLVNVTLVPEDGSEGYGPGAPYDRILINGAIEAVPRAFLDQMASPGILVCAVGPAEGEQVLTRHHKAGSRFETELLASVRTQALKPGVAAVL
ncbi:protein-L-isoaspartate(D-aspartate) O-methyltransferase [Aureimonas populi]|uniref:Protein-L-isoaspartate O-methyltransferase n=1 Tax=Aureimonas populi TaxID=1701758 RepID=A0ABW5CH93_9HYPH|nr:protein-L-isoaspartate(D-aspartate) O-methyltransferase [Aureimonas populi]